MIARELFDKHRRLANWLIMSAVAASMLLAVWACLRQQPVALTDINLSWSFAAAVLYALFCVANAWGWSLVQAALAHRMPAAAAICLWIRCESLRWLPGSVWNLGARAVETTRRGTPHLICAASMILEVLFAVSSRLLIVLAVCLAWHRDLRSLWAQIPLPGSTTVVCFAVAIATIAAITALLSRRVCQTWQQRQIHDVLVALRRADHTVIKLLCVQCYYVATSVLHGCGFVCVVHCIQPDSSASFATLVAINSAAWLVGFFAIFAPGGLVVREAFLAVALAGWCAPAEAITIAVGWRALQIIVEASILGAAVMMERPGPAHLLQQRSPEAIQ